MNKNKTIVVIGGVAAGASAAAKARREDEYATIIVYEKGEYVSFANCGLPYYVGDEIKKESSLLLHTPKSLKERFNLDVYVKHEVLAIQPEQSVVVVKNLLTDEVFSQHYDACIIATGAKPVVPPIEGIKAANIQLLRTVPDAITLKSMIVEGKVKKAVVIGGGFIGLEAIENLIRQGVSVTIIEKAPQVLTPFDIEMTTPVMEELSGMGVEVILQNGITRFVGSENQATAVVLEDGSTVPADVFILSIGVRPDVTLAADAGIRLGRTGAILVDEYMQTSIPGIYAAGDAVECKHRVHEQSVWIPLAGPANKQGRVAGANAAGGRMKFKGAYGTSIVRVGEVVAAKTGLSEKECQQAGLETIVTYNYHGHHVGYYPGAEGMMIKLIAEDNDGRILGAQIVGKDGVDKRIDVIATAIYANMTVEDLEQLDLAYAPPFGAAKDPVVMAGMQQSNIIRGEIMSCTPAELDKKMTQNQLQLLDVRNPNEWAEGGIPNAIQIPLHELRSRIGELDPEKEVVVHCKSGQRSYFAAKFLSQMGFSRVINLTGGFLAWRLYEKNRTYQTSI